MGCSSAKNASEGDLAEAAKDGVSMVPFVGFGTALNDFDADLVMINGAWAQSPEGVNRTPSIAPPFQSASTHKTEGGTMD